MPHGFLARRETFSASHRLHSYALSDAENRELFGKCNNPHGHGHNYVLEITVYGEVCPTTGLVMNLTTLKQLIANHVLSRVDHRHLNEEVSEFRTLNPTAENIAYVIWHWLQPHLGALLHEVKLGETENNFAVYRGN